jgi:hypothetical protein
MVANAAEGHLGIDDEPIVDRQGNALDNALLKAGERKRDLVAADGQ